MSTVITWTMEDRTKLPINLKTVPSVTRGGGGGGGEGGGSYSVVKMEIKPPPTSTSPATHPPTSLIFTADLAGSRL